MSNAADLGVGENQSVTLTELSQTPNIVILKTNIEAVFGQAANNTTKNQGGGGEGILNSQESNFEENSVEQHNFHYVEGALQIMAQKFALAINDPQKLKNYELEVIRSHLMMGSGMKQGEIKVQ